MKVSFFTNLDDYRHIDWPTVDVVPRKGEFIEVPSGYNIYCQSKRIPKRLEICSVTYCEDYVRVELWFNETDFKLYGGGEKLLK